MPHILILSIGKALELIFESDIFSVSFDLENPELAKYDLLY